MYRIFTCGTKLQKKERGTDSNFTERRNLTMKLNKILNNNKVGRCIDCVEFKNGKCQLTNCSYIFERIEMGVIGYGYMLKDIFSSINEFNFKKRLSRLINNFNGEMFLDSNHKNRFNNICQQVHFVLGNLENDYLATIYLLTANEELWNCTKANVYINNCCFDKMHLKNININEYALYKTAEMIYTNKICMKISELGDEKIISDEVFKTVINAIAIKEHGCDILVAKFKEGKNQTNEVKH